MTGKSSVDFSIFPQEELLKALERINKDKFPANYKACKEEILLRQQRGLWQSEADKNQGRSGIIPSYLAAWDRYRGQWAFFWIILALWLPFAILAVVLGGAVLLLLVFGAAIALTLYNARQRALFKCPRCLQNFFPIGAGRHADVHFKSCQHCGLAKFAVTDES